METQDPLATPRLERFELEYDRQLLATSLTSTMAPPDPVLAVRAAVGRQADGPDGNLQYAAEGTEGWTLIGQGFVSGVLPRRAVQVSPNPFNASRGPTVIRIDLAKVQVPEPVTVRIHDLSGRPVRTLWRDREVTAGRHRVEWDGRDDAGQVVVPGIYLVRVEVRADRGAEWVGTVGVVY